jgi:hypothetical protein
MHVCAVAEVVLAAVKLSKGESSSSALPCGAQLHPKPAGCQYISSITSIVRRKAAELSKARVCKQLHCKRGLV